MYVCVCVCVCIAVHPGAQQVPLNDNGEETLGRGFQYRAGQNLNTCLWPKTGPLLAQFPGVNACNYSVDWAH